MMDDTYETTTRLRKMVNGTVFTTKITVNDRAATREAIIRTARRAGLEFVPRSDWAAYKNRPEKMVNDWNYKQVAIHHAGRSFACGPAALQLQQMQKMQMGRAKAAADDIAYHYAIDCLGTIYEGRDIRFKGEHIRKFNTGVIGIVLLENLTTAEEGKDFLATVRTMMVSVGIGNPPSVPLAQAEALESFIRVLLEFFEITKLGGHRECPNQLKDGKICPGNVGLVLVKTLREKLSLAIPE